MKREFQVIKINLNNCSTMFSKIIRYSSKLIFTHGSDLNRKLAAGWLKVMFYSLMIIWISISCSNSNKAGLITEPNNFKDNSELRMDTIVTGYDGLLIYNDSIKFSDFLSMQCQMKTPVNENDSSDILGNIGLNDTLKLFAEFCQCGEFGGNQENILIYRSRSGYECLITKDSVSCRYNNGGQKHFRVTENRYKLDKMSRRAVLDYLELMLRYSFKKQKWCSNAAGYFSAKIIRDVYFRNDFSIDLYDCDMSWIYFDLLKNEIIENASRKYFREKN